MGANVPGFSTFWPLRTGQFPTQNTRRVVNKKKLTGWLAVSLLPRFGQDRGQMSGAKFSETFLGGSKGFFAFAERKANLRGAVFCVIVKARTRNAGHTNFLDQVFRKRYIS